MTGEASRKMEQQCLITGLVTHVLGYPPLFTFHLYNKGQKPMHIASRIPKVSLPKTNARTHDQRQMQGHMVVGSRHVTLTPTITSSHTQTHLVQNITSSHTQPPITITISITTHTTGYPPPSLTKNLLDLGLTSGIRSNTATRSLTVPGPHSSRLLAISLLQSLVSIGHSASRLQGFHLIRTRLSEQHPRRV